MKYGISYWVLGVFLAILLGCKKDDPAPTPSPKTGIRLKVQTVFEGQPFQLNQTYENATDYRITVEALKFYLAQITWVDSDGNETVSAEIEIFDQSNAVDFIYELPAGNYDELKLGIGVPEVLNGTADPDFDPSLYPSGHPLNIQDHGMYWVWNTGYRFVLFEGKADTSAAGDEPLLYPFAFHTGTDSLYRLLEFDDIDLVVSQDELTDMVLTVDVAKFFYSDADTIDLKEHHITHTVGGAFELAERFTALFVGAVALE